MENNMIRENIEISNTDYSVDDQSVRLMKRNIIELSQFFEDDLSLVAQLVLRFPENIKILFRDILNQTLIENYSKNFSLKDIKREALNFKAQCFHFFSVRSELINQDYENSIGLMKSFFRLMLQAESDFVDSLFEDKKNKESFSNFYTAMRDEIKKSLTGERNEIYPNWRRFVLWRSNSRLIKIILVNFIFFSLWSTLYYEFISPPFQKDQNTSQVRLKDENITNLTYISQNETNLTERQNITTNNRSDFYIHSNSTSVLLNVDMTAHWKNRKNLKANMQEDLSLLLKVWQLLISLALNMIHNFFNSVAYGFILFLTEAFLIYLGEKLNSSQS